MYIARKSVAGMTTRRKRWKESAVVPICFVIVITLLAPTVYYINFYNPTIGSNDCNILTVAPSGHLIHQIHEYMSLYAVWKLNENEFGKYNVKPYIRECMKETLSDVFIKTSIPVLSLKCDSIPYDITQKINSEDEFHVGPSRSVRYVLNRSSYRYKDIIDYGITNIKEELRFHPELINKVEEIFQNIRNSNRIESIVCMHFRGVDHNSYLKDSFENLKEEPDYKYYVNAMNYYKQKFDNKVIFVLLTIQREWLRKNQARIVSNGIVEVNPFKIKDQVLDFALLSSCNHSVISYGAFATTAALLSEGEAIVYDAIHDKKPLEKLTESLGIAKYLPTGKWLVGNETYIGNCSEFH